MKTGLFVNFRTLIIFLLLTFCFSSVQAQSNKGKFRFGLKAGVDGANLYDDAQAKDRNSRIGFLGGAFMKIPVGRRFDIRPELLFIMKGGIYDAISGDVGTNVINHELKLGYVELPLSLELKLLGIFNLHGGVQTAYLVNADGVFKDPQGNEIKVNLDANDFERLDYGWHLGGGIDIGKIGLHLRVARSLKEVGKDPLLVEIGKLKNSSWALTFSLAL